MGTCNKEGIINAFNLYKTITEADSPLVLLSVLADIVMPLPKDKIVAEMDNIEKKDEETGIYRNYLHFFAENSFMRGDE